MSSPNDHSIWFPAKRYGWGWGLPVAWQGWVVLIGWIVVLTLVTPILLIHTVLGFIAFVFFMSVLLIAICYAKGETPEWRWGR
jgi:hypothetical protein